MRDCRKVQPSLSSIHKVCKMPHRVSKSALTEEKKKGIKRQITTDTIGCLLSVVVHKANLHDTKIGIWAATIAFLLYPTIEKFCGDGGYRKTFVEEVKKYLELEVEISEKITTHSWHLISPRWIVE